jgi:hypothetical protein
MMIETLDGRVYTGDTLRDVIEQMRAAAWAVPSRTLRAYMRGVSKRVFQWNKQPVRDDSVDHFVDDLVAAGILVIHTPQ